MGDDWWCCAIEQSHNEIDKIENERPHWIIGIMTSQSAFHLYFSKIIISPFTSGAFWLSINQLSSPFMQTKISSQPDAKIILQNYRINHFNLFDSQYT